MSNLEAHILQKLREGDGDAFTEVVETYQTPVYNLCYRMLGNPQEAEDAAQETFWRAYSNIKRYDDSRSFATWLLSIAAHFCIDQQRKRRLPTFSMELIPDEIVPGSTPDPEKIMFRSEEERLMRRVLSNLKPTDRAAIVLRYWYEMSEEEISESLDLSVSAVKSRLFRARRQLADEWKAEHPESANSERKCHESPAF